MRNEENDYYEDSDVPEVPKPPKEPKKPTLHPEDPRYWDEPEPEFEHLRPDPKSRIWWWLAAFGLIIGILITVYIRWFQPYSENAVQYGYVENIEHKGMLFKTFEGTLLPYKNLMDTTRVYEGDFHFSTTDERVAVTLRKMQYAHRPVRVVFKTYLGRVPWRGDTKYMIVEADSVNPTMILPPDRTPEIHK